jgi:tRNA-splicing ligase RtcB
MLLHAVDLDLERFNRHRDTFVSLMKGDYFFGSRDVTATAETSRGMFDRGIVGLLEGTTRQPLGSVRNSDLGQLWQECDRVRFLGSLDGSSRYAPPELVPDKGLVRDGDLGTIGGGNHFVEVQQITEVVDRATAYQWGVKAGMVAIVARMQPILTFKA